MISDKLDSKSLFKNGLLKKNALNEYGENKVKEYQVDCKTPVWRLAVCQEEIFRK